MTGPAHFASDVDAASAARAGLDRAAALVQAVEAAQRAALAALVGLWPCAAWLAAGLDSGQKWLVAHTTLTYPEAARLARIAELCARDPRLATAVIEGACPLGRADRLARAVTAERAPFLDGSIDALLAAASGFDDTTFDVALRFWTERVDEHLAPRRMQSQSLVFAEHLFGGGEVFGSFAPVPFATIRAAIDAFTQDPDPEGAPYRRTLSERRADAMDDLAAFVLAHDDATNRFTGRQRRAIAARDACCVFPGCTRIPAHCDIHHLHERAVGGPTTASNGVLLCRFHHRLVHQHRWSLHRDEDGTWVAVDVHGERWRPRPAHQRAA